MRVRKRAEDDAAHQTEDGGVRADAESKCEDSNDREAEVATQQTRPVANVLREVVEPAAAPLIARDVLDERDVAEFAAGGFGGLLRGSATLYSIARGHFEMGGDFLFERVLLFVAAIVG